MRCSLLLVDPRKFAGMESALAQLTILHFTSIIILIIMNVIIMIVIVIIIITATIIIIIMVIFFYPNKQQGLPYIFCS